MISTLELLLVAFVVLKLCGIIAWSWLWVLAPLWAGPAIFIIALSVLFLAGLIILIVDLAA